MRKYSIVFLLMCLLSCFIYTNYSLNKIKFVKSSLLDTTMYTPTVNVTGEFVYADEYKIILSFPAIVKDVYVKENSFVNKGQALFTIDKSKMASIVSGNNYDELSYISEITDYSEIKRQLESFNTKDIIEIADTVYAPESGVITELNIFSGGLILANQQLVTIGHTDEIVAKLILSQIDYGKISVGDKVNIQPIAFNNITYDGTISKDNAIIKDQHSLSGSKRVVEVFADINNPDEIVSDGLQINGNVYCGQEKQIYTLAYDFIYQDENGQFVYILENGKATRKDIDTGIESSSYAQIITDFSIDTVFLSGEISEGDRVIVLE